MKVSGAQALFKALEGEGVDIVFGIPGGAILPAYDPLIESGVRHVLCRHEQGAGHAAEGYAWATGKVGVAIATSGPGGCNLVTALADAKMDSVPIVAITGQVPMPAVGNANRRGGHEIRPAFALVARNVVQDHPADCVEAYIGGINGRRARCVGPMLPAALVARAGERGLP